MQLCRGIVAHCDRLQPGPGAFCIDELEHQALLVNVTKVRRDRWTDRGVGVGGTDVGVEGMGVDVGAGVGSTGGNDVFVGEGTETAEGEGVGRSVGVSIATCVTTGFGVADAVGSAGTGVTAGAGTRVGTPVVAAAAVCG